MIMMTMMIMMMKIENGLNSANFEATFYRFGMVIDLNHTYRMMVMIRTIMVMMVMMKMKLAIFPTI